jgi:ribonuclease VapC
MVAITEREAAAALEAFSRFGEGRGRPAHLNLGDCFAHAVAKTHQTALLLKRQPSARADIKISRR